MLQKYEITIVQLLAMMEKHHGRYLLKGMPDNLQDSDFER